MGASEAGRPGGEGVGVLAVTGGTGFVGSVVVARALAQGRRVRVLVRDPARAAALLPAGTEVVVADVVRDGADALARALAGADAVVHLAGAVAGSEADLRLANVGGTTAVLAAARVAGVGRVVVTGSSAAVIDATGLVAEQPVAPPAMTDPYSVSKAEAERLALDAGAVVVSSTSVYGPSPAGPYSYVALFLAAARGEVPEVVDADMGWVYSADAATGHLLALDRGEGGRRYVLCGEVAPFGDVLHAFAEQVGGHRVRVLPRGSRLGADAGPFARRSEVYGAFPSVRVDAPGAAALGFRGLGVAEGVRLTAEWISRLGHRD